jgi:hypothetical protein
MNDRGAGVLSRRVSAVAAQNTERRGVFLITVKAGPRSARKVPAPARFQRCFDRGPGCNRWQSVHRFAILMSARQWE